MQLTSLLPRPKPLMILPLSLMGKGASGPDSGPVTAGRVMMNQSEVEERYGRGNV